MKWVRYFNEKREQYGILRNNLLYPQKISRDINGVEEYLTESFDPQFEVALELSESSTLKWLPPIARPGKIICVGRNYAAHSIEQGKEPESIPLLFTKYSTSMTGPNAQVPFPRHSEYFDYEVELAVVIGKTTFDLKPEEDPQDSIFGLTVANDLTARDVQKSEKQWTRGKAFDNSMPIGPSVVPLKDLNDLSNLDIWLKVNGELRQESNTSHMIFSIPYLIRYISQVITLQPGDILMTGTPEGVGFYMDPVSTLQKGDQITSGVSGLDELHFSIQ
ncbi:MAG: fumarylacetoacetate hydrolase family protein [Candidatus Kariarchaeaceae archaeon]|jgi:acylpyruvate hydrolase